jgi:hypothetical protein
VQIEDHEVALVLLWIERFHVSRVEERRSVPLETKEPALTKPSEPEKVDAYMQSLLLVNYLSKMLSPTEIQENRRQLASQRKRATLASVHERNHRRPAQFDATCPLCRYQGKKAIEGGQADKLHLSEELYQRLAILGADI